MNKRKLITIDKEIAKEYEEFLSDNHMNMSKHITSLIKNYLTKEKIKSHDY